MSLDTNSNDGPAGERPDNVQPGVEQVTGTVASGDRLEGNNRPNSLRGLEGDDTLIGHGGPDALLGGAGRDLLDGGADGDTAGYADHARGVVADLDGVADDGAPGENDRLDGMEHLTGGPGPDRLTGDGGVNQLTGGGGGDTLIGDDGDDRLLGNGGGDELVGGGGTDGLLGGDGDDRLIAQPVPRRRPVRQRCERQRPARRGRLGLLRLRGRAVALRRHAARR